MDHKGEAVACGRFTLHLLDSVKGRPVQTWSYEQVDRLVIGRGEGADLQVADPKVSRVHAVLSYREGCWWLESQGRHGTLIDGVKMSEAPLNHRSVFRLGSDGPTFQFETFHMPDAQKQTIDSIDTAGLAFLIVNEAETIKEVEEIATGDTFRQLQEQARKLKEQRAKNES